RNSSLLRLWLPFSSLCFFAWTASACERGQKDPEQGGQRSGTGSGGADPADDPMNATTGGSSTGGNTMTGTGGSVNEPPQRSSGCGVDAGFHGERTFNIELPGPGGQNITREYGVRAPAGADYDR